MCGGKAVAPGTDNFELAPFTVDGTQYWSAEQAYQALKLAGAADRAKVERCAPKKGESAWGHGMRVWQAGQLGRKRPDWEAVKVEAMYFVNRCKLEQNPDALASLLDCNGAPRGPITHRGSGKFWDEWNPVILMLLREELRTGDSDHDLIEQLHARMREYRVARGGRSFLDEVAARMPPEGE